MITVDRPHHKNEGHTIYRLKDGTIVKGASTICNVLAKPALVKWANNLGLQGIDSNRYVDSLAEAGTLAHYLVECDMAGIPVNQDWLDEYSRKDIDRAETSFLKYLDWRKGKTLEVIGHELQLVSEEHRFGGTLDWLVIVDGVLTLIDIKTCKALYGALDDKWTQVAGYEILARENDYVPQEVRILRLGRDPAEGFEYALSPNRELHRQRFLLANQIDKVNEAIKGRAA